MKTQQILAVWLVTMMFAFVAMMGCGGGEAKPSQLPISTATDRTQHKIGRVDIIVSDADRATATKQTLRQIETLLADSAKAMAERRSALFAQDLTGEASQAAARELFAAERTQRAELWKRYVALQLQLRSQLTEDEFNQLSAVR